MVDTDLNFTCSFPWLSKNNITEDVWQIREEAHLEYSVIAATASILAMLIGIPWNAVLLAILVLRQKYKDPTYIFVLNLVVTDCLVCALVLPVNTHSAINQKFTIGHSDYIRCTVCNVTVICFVTLSLVSLFTLGLMSLDRFIYVGMNIQYSQYVTSKRVVMALCTVWLVCFIVAIPPVFGLGGIQFDDVFGVCMLIINRRNPVYNYIIFLAFYSSLSHLAMLIGNIGLLVLACRSISQRYKRSLRNSGGKTDSKLTAKEKGKLANYQKEQRHLLKVFIILFAANFVSSLPLLILAPLEATLEEENIIRYYALIYLIIFTRPAVCPVLETCLIGKPRDVKTSLQVEKEGAQYTSWVVCIIDSRGCIKTSFIVFISESSVHQLKTLIQLN